MDWFFPFLLGAWCGAGLLMLIFALFAVGR